MNISDHYNYHDSVIENGHSGISSLSANPIICWLNYLYSQFVSSSVMETVELDGYIVHLTGDNEPH